jgi:small-conductance mechanosensitive channel
MAAADLRIQLAASFWERNHQWVSAAISLALAFALAYVVDRQLERRGRRLAAAVTRGAVSPEIDTRLRFVRRLIYAAILLIGIASALSEFTGVSRLAASVLASGAIVAAIIGFAAQRTLGNVVAGIMLAVTQPMRIGDWVAFEEHYGVVEDVRLNVTILRAPGEQRIVVPNERIASGVLRNDTLVVDTVGLEATLWIPRWADADAAVLALEAETGASVSVAEATLEGVRLAVSGARVAPAGRAAGEAARLARCLRRLRAEGLLDQA